MKSQGFVAPGFESVLDQFEANLENVEVGAAFAVYQDGQPVVDLWGGVADAETSRPWTRDTSTLIFSGTKGILSTVLLGLCSCRVLDLDRPVADYWPEFGAGDKAHVTVSDFATYTAGVPAIRQQAVDQDMVNNPRLMASLVAQEPRVKAPRLIYGPFTMGWILDELCVRTTGLEARELFRHVAVPMGCPFGDDRGTRYLHVLRVALGDPGAPDLAQTGLGARDHRAGHHGKIQPARKRVIVPRLDRGVLITGDGVPAARLADHLVEECAGAFLPVIGSQFRGEHLPGVFAQLGALVVGDPAMPHVTAGIGTEVAVQEAPVLERLDQLARRVVVRGEVQRRALPLIDLLTGLFAGELVEVERQLPIGCRHAPGHLPPGRCTTTVERATGSALPFGQRAR